MDIKLLKNHKHWNAKPTKLDGKDATEFHGKWINYLDANDNWQEINTDFVETVDKFEMKNAPFEMYIPLYSDGVATQHINNRWGVGIKQKIKDVPIDITIKAIGVSKVKGIIEIGDLGWGETNYVIYKNAWSNADLIYYIQHGKAPRLRKLVRFNSNPNLTADAKFSFELGYSDNTESFIWDWDKLPVGLQKHQYRKLDRNETKQITDRGLSFKLKGSNRRGATFKSLRIWDSKRDTESNDNSELWNGNIWQRVNSEVEHIENGKIILTKIIPKSFFDKEITYPVFTDFASTFHPQQDAETVTVDGGILENVGGNGQAHWDAAHDSTSAFVTTDSADNRYVGANYGGAGTINIERAVFLFDTSSIGATDNINAAVLYLWWGGTQANYNDGNDFMSVVQVQSLASDTSLAVGDFGEIGDAAQSADSTEAHDVGERIDISGASTGQYNTHTFNATGRGWIARSGESILGGHTAGITYLGWVEGHDLTDTPGSIVGGSAETGSSAQLYLAEKAGTSNDPKLVVSHTPATIPSTASLPQSGSIQNRWLFDEASGNAEDSQLNDDLTDNNSVGAGTGLSVTNASYDNSRSFNGSTQYFSHANNTRLSITGSFTFGVWIRFASFPSSPNVFWIVAKRRWDTQNRSYGFALQNDGGTYKLQTDISDDGTGKSVDSATWTTPVVDTWYHIAMAYNNSAGTVEYYVDGSSIGTGTGYDNVIHNGDADFGIGAGNSNSWSDFFNGLMQDGIIWTRTLTDGEVTTLYNVYTASAGPANVKTVDTTAIANVKTINGVAIALVKTINTVE